MSSPSIPKTSPLEAFEKMLGMSLEEFREQERQRREAAEREEQRIFNEFMEKFKDTIVLDGEKPTLPLAPLLRPPPLLRQIREDYWQSGEYALMNNPDLNEVEVFYHRWDPRMCWQFKVVRKDGELVRQTWLNDELVGETSKKI
jgi:hypothetical protein